MMMKHAAHGSPAYGADVMPASSASSVSTAERTAAAAAAAAVDAAWQMVSAAAGDR
jgi:hypothetical protein